MGTRNRSRRAEKKRRRQRLASEPRPPRGGPAGGGTRFDAALVRQALFAATDACRHQDRAGYADLLDVLTQGGGTTAGRRVVAKELASMLGETLRRTWRRGWQPADLARVVDRRGGARHAAFVIDVIAADALRFAAAPADPCWADQVQGLGAHVWWSLQEPHLDQWARREGLLRADAMACGIEALSLLLQLPEVPRLCDVPGEAGPRRPAPEARRGGHDSRLLDRIRALLAKAESTTFAEEAEALSAKAQELMARHAIDEAMVAAAGGSKDAPVGIRIGIDDPYAPAKSLLLSEVASANGCRSVWAKALGFTTVLGFESDVEFVELLYTSLLVQATSAMVAAGSQVDRYGRSRTRSFRHSFLVAYATRIGQRLRAAEAACVEAAGEVYGQALLPVLASRTAVVDQACDDAFPGLVSHSVSTTNDAGWAAGAAAAEMASLSGRQEVAARAAAAHAAPR